MPAIRQAAVAGQFYPGESAALAAEVRALLAAAPAAGSSKSWPKALIVPHAGYPYSGPIAASAYARLAPGRDAIRRVVLLGPAHRVAVRGLALPSAAEFTTPLGRVPVDRAALELVRSLPQVLVNDAAHAQEHSLEVQLPFLQTVLREFALVPFAVGSAGPEEVAGVLERLWGGAETLIVVSSDLSHYHPYGEARELDRATAEGVLALRGALDPRQACGARPINGLALCARRHALAAELLDLRSSGDTAGDRARVVGYGAFAFEQDEALGRALLAEARAAILGQLGQESAPAPAHAALAAPGAAFVTLRRGGALRGCIGTLEARRPLRDDVRDNALGAAFRDPRFPPLAQAELEGLELEVSLLSPPERLRVASEAELLAALVPGVDGLILECEGKRATFLPQVWEQLPDAREFVAALRKKAGIPAGSWSPAMRAFRYSAAKWKEREAR